MANKLVTLDGLEAFKEKSDATYASKSNGIHYIVGNTSGTAGTWTGTCDDITEYYDGLTIAYKVGIAGASTTSLNINGLGAKTIYLRGTAKLTTQYAADTVIIAVYTTVSGTGRWYVNDYDANSNTVPSVQCETAAGTAAKVGTCTNYTLRAKSFVHVNIRYANTYAGAITLNINSTGAKPIYLDGSATANNNYSLPAGTYIVYYDGTNFYFRTDEKLTASVTGNAATASRLGTADKGSATQPIYLSDGTPVACTYTLGKSVPSNAVFTDTTYSAATTSAAGLMSAADKTKLDGIATGANKTTVDSALSSTSTNPVQNKVINSALAGKLGTSAQAADSAKLGGVAASSYALKTDLPNYDRVVVDYRTIEGLEYDDDTIYWDTDLIFENGGTEVQRKQVTVQLPLIAGDGVSFTLNPSADRMVVNATGGSSSLYGDWELPSQSVALGDTTYLYFDVPRTAKIIEVWFEKQADITFKVALFDGDFFSIDTSVLGADSADICSLVIDVFSRSATLYGYDYDNEWPAMAFVSSIPVSNGPVGGGLVITNDASRGFSADAVFTVRGTSYYFKASENY